jgi:hypothetical protein
MRKNTAREADLICSQFPRAGFFVGVDGLPLQIAFRLLSVVKMRVELSAKDFLHLSEIWLESGGQWLRLNAGMVRSMRQSSIARDPASGELSVWLAGEKSFFSTANEEFPYIEFQLTKPLEITGLKIINRRDGCWERAQSLRLLLLDGVSQRWCCVYDGASNLDLADRVLEVISALTIAAPRLASSFAAADSSAPNWLL